MPFAYWCILIAALLPLAIVTFAKAGAGGNNHHPRDDIEALSPERRRAYAAHQNAYENFPFFAVAVISSTTLGASISTVNVLATVYIALRVAHALLYINDSPTLRSAAFAAGLFVNIAIFVLPAFN